MTGESSSGGRQVRERKTVHSRTDFQDRPFHERNGNRAARLCSGSSISVWRCGMSDNKGGMTEEEARSFHGYMVMGTLAYVAIAVAAHLLAWSWRPWF
jgi:light-harvesting complex 1 beta chain